MAENHTSPWWKGKTGLVLLGFALIGGFFLLAEHRAHVYGTLPYILLFLCPLMHLFHGHGRHRAPESGGADRREDALQ